MKFAIFIEFMLVSVIFAVLQPPPPVKKDPFKHYLDKVRCSRRYSVGECAEPVVPVWTYVPHLQNCTERLGCHSATISNRFPTPEICMEKCKCLRDLYTMLISETNLNDTDQLRSSNANIGRRGDAPSDEDEYPLLPESASAPAPASASDYPEPSAAPAQLHTELFTQEESYGDVPPEAEFWQG